MKSEFLKACEQIILDTENRRWREWQRQLNVAASVDEAIELEKLAAEVLGNWSLPAIYTPPANSPLNYPVPSAGSQSQPAVASIYGQRIPGLDQPSEFGKMAAEELKRAQAGAAKPPVGSTQRVIPDRCKYSRRQPIPGAPKVPMSVLTGERHPDLLEAAQKKIRGYVCRSYRAFPACPCTNRNVTIDYDYGYDAELGDVLVGMFRCEECK